MSAPENLDTRARLLVYARWAAIGLAALAALIIAAFSGPTALRIAAFMAVIAVVLVVLSITMNGAESTKVHLEETLLDEIDMLRDDVRADITTAARATHRALAEKVAHLHENVEHMRRNMDNRALGEAPQARPIVGPPPARRAIAGAAGPVVHHTETVHVTTHQTYVDPADDERDDRYDPRPAARRPERDERGAPGGWDRVERPRADERPRTDDRARGDERPRTDGRVRPEDRPRAEERARTDDRVRGERVRGEERPRSDDRVRSDDRARSDDRPRGTVEPIRRRDRDDRDDRDDSHGHRSGASRPVAREDSWTDARLRDHPAKEPVDPYDDSGEIAAWRNPRAAEPIDDPADDPRWSGMRSGDRWAEVRTDDRGRELRMGERRTAIRADETGTHMRVVDRWSSVRRENPGYSGYDEDPSGGYRTGADNTGETRRERRHREEAEEALRRSEDDDRRSGRRSGAGVDEGSWTGSDRARPALPAAGPESASGWMRGRDDRDADDRSDRRSRRDISGEVIHPRGPVEPQPRVQDAPRSTPRRPDARPEPRADSYSDPRSGHGASPEDNRWEREPSGGRSAVRQRRLDFDVSDDRWR